MVEVWYDIFSEHPIWGGNEKDSTNTPLMRDGRIFCSKNKKRRVTSQYSIWCRERDLVAPPAATRLFRLRSDLGHFSFSIQISES